MSKWNSDLKPEIKFKKDNLVLNLGSCFMPYVSKQNYLLKGVEIDKMFTYKSFNLSL